MTSWDAPEYSITFNVIDISEHELAIFSGNCFTVSILRGDGRKPIKGMVMFTEYHAGEFNKELASDLWIYSPKAIIPLRQTVSITLLEACDPMYHYDDSEKQAVKKLLPTTLFGEIKEIENISNEEIRHIKILLKKGSE